MSRALFTFVKGERHVEVGLLNTFDVLVGSNIESCLRKVIVEWQVETWGSFSRVLGQEVRWSTGHHRERMACQDSIMCAI
jgi:hypothetical protein